MTKEKELYVHDGQLVMYEAVKDDLLTLEALFEAGVADTKVYKEAMEIKERLAEERKN